MNAPLNWCGIQLWDPCDPHLHGCSRITELFYVGTDQPTWGRCGRSTIAHTDMANGPLVVPSLLPQDRYSYGELRQNKDWKI
jgi:hypothetical protein